MDDHRPIKTETKQKNYDFTYRRVATEGANGMEIVFGDILNNQSTHGSSNAHELALSAFSIFQALQKIVEIHKKMNTAQHNSDS